MDYSIRLCTLEDLPDIYTHELAYIREIEPGSEQRWTAAIPKHLKQWISLLDTTFILDNGAETIGHFSWMDQDGKALLVSIYIQPPYRRLGLAGRLMDRFEDEARKHGRRECILGVFETNPAEKLYQNRGYLFTDDSGAYRNYIKHL